MLLLNIFYKKANSHPSNVYQMFIMSSIVQVSFILRYIQAKVNYINLEQLQNLLLNLNINQSKKIY